MSTGLRVGIDARISSGTRGGIQQIVVGLAQGLRAVGDDRIRPVVLVWPGESDWLTPHLDPSWEVIAVPPPPPSPRLRRVAARVPAAVRSGRRERGYGRPFDHRALMVPTEPPAVREAGLDLVHFPYQAGFLTGVPTVYQPHDLQHEHLPEYFTRVSRYRRRAVYGSLAQAAELILVGTSWVRRDVIDKLRVPAERVLVVPVAPPRLPESPLPASDDLPGEYLLYPAAPWPHKNHHGLLQAVAILRSRGIDVPVVLPGARGKGDHIPVLLRELGLEDLVVVPGFVDESTLASLYRHAKVVCVPSLFESASFPIWEAFQQGVPVASSNVTALPQQVGDAGVLFDPHDVNSIADAVEQLWTDRTLRASLVERGSERVRGVSLTVMARRYVAAYLLAANRRLSTEDEALLAEPPLL